MRTDARSAMWGGDEAAYAAAIKTVQPEVAGHRRFELSEAPETGHTPAARAGLPPVPQRHRSNPVTSAELARMVRLFQEFGDIPKVCNRIGELLTPPRHRGVVANALARAGVRAKHRRRRDDQTSRASPRL
jgi:hypothetical protein